MGLTKFPNGVSSFGTPVIGGGSQRFSGWWGKAYFVDFDNGSDGNSGTDIDQPFKYLQTAIDLATYNDVIYVRNREQDITSTDPEYQTPESTTNWSVAEAQTHLSIIGASNVSHIPTQEGQIACYMRGSTNTTSPVMNWQGAFGLIENLAFHRGSSTYGQLILTGNSTSLRALGTCVSNCLFRMDNSAMNAGGSVNYGGALRNIDNWFVTVYGCTFHDCRFGVVMYGSATTCRRDTIEACRFLNQTATSVDTNIYISGTPRNITIKDCLFAVNTPNYSGGTNYFINVVQAAEGVVSGCQFPIDTNEGTTSMEINGMDAIACWQAVTTTAADPTWGLAT